MITLIFECRMYLLNIYYIQSNNPGILATRMRWNCFRFLKMPRVHLRHLWTTHFYHYPENTRRCHSVGLMLAHRLRRWANIKPTLWRRLVFADTPWWCTNPDCYCYHKSWVIYFLSYHYAVWDTLVVTKTQYLQWLVFTCLTMEIELYPWSDHPRIYLLSQGLVRRARRSAPLGGRDLAREDVSWMELNVEQQGNTTATRWKWWALHQNRNQNHSEANTAVVRARSFADVVACRAVSNPAWCRIFREISCFSPLNLGTLLRCCVLGQRTSLSNASLDSGENEYLVWQTCQSLR